MAENELQLILFIQATLGLIVLIVFFLMANNVNKIRRILHPSKEEWMEEYWKAFSSGDHSRAIRCLNEASWFDIKDGQMNNLIKSIAENNYKAAKEKWEPFYKQVGGEFPKMIEFDK